MRCSSCLCQFLLCSWLSHSKGKAHDEHEKQVLKLTLVSLGSTEEEESCSCSPGNHHDLAQRWCCDCCSKESLSSLTLAGCTTREETALGHAVCESWLKERMIYSFLVDFARSEATVCNPHPRSSIIPHFKRNLLLLECWTCETCKYQLIGGVANVNIRPQQLI